MCGIVGIMNPYGSFSWKIKDAFTEMLYADAIRGKDSTGVFTVKHNEVDWIKAAVPPWKFFSMEKVPDFFRDIDRAKFIVGHNRAASKGSVSNKNAHPFQVKHICGVHNGTLWGTHDLEVDNTIEVDSEMVFTAIAKEGITKVSPKLRGSYSLAWYNQETKNMNFLRNTERPMFFLWTKTPELIFFGSELGLLEWAAKRNKYEISHSLETEPHTIYKFKDGATKPTILKVKAYEPKTYGGVMSWPHQRHNSIIPYNDGENIADAVEVEDVVPVERKEIPQAVAQVFPFPKSKPPANVPKPQKDASYRNWLAALATQWKKGSYIEFSIHDWGDRCQGGFLPVVGKHPRWPEEVFIKGNYNGTEEALLATKYLMRGKITQIAVLKHKNQVLIQVSEVRHTENLDPLQEKKGPQKEDSGHNGLWICSDCGYRKMPPEKPFIREIEGLTEYVCKECLEQEAEDCTRQGGCHCETEKEFCIFYNDGDSAVCKEVGKEERPTLQ